MDKNTITGFVLIALVIIGFSWYSSPSEAERAEMARQDSIRIAQQQSIEQTQANQIEEAAPICADSASLFFNHLSGTEEVLTLKNQFLSLEFHTKGGMPTKATITSGLGIKEGKPVDIIDESNKLSFVFNGKRENIDTRNYYFTPIQHTDSTLVMRLAQEDGTALDIAYTLPAHSYMLNMELRSTGLARHFEPNTKSLFIEWEKDAKMLEKGFDFENRFSSLTYKVSQDDVDNLSESSNDKEEIAQALDWVAFKNQFFSCVLIGHQDLTHATLESKKQDKPEKPIRYESVLKHYSASMQTAFDPTGAQPTHLQFYLGPNDFHLLKDVNKQGTVKTDLELEEMIYFGWPLFKWINRFFILYLFDWLNGWGLPMGIVLLLLTLIVKLVVYPSTKKSFISSAKMRVLKPQIDALSAKYPNQEDAMKKQQEMMQIYSQYGVSPMGGCLPMLLQTPIWIALFNFVPNAIALRGESFLWAQDLSAYDDLLRWDTNLWFIGDHLSIFCVLFTLTNLINTWISMRQQQNQMSGEQAQQMKMMQYMMFFMPLIFFFMLNEYSSGLCYYYFLSGLLNILMMWYLRKTTDENRLRAKLEAYRQQHKNDPKKASGLAARLEALQKMQEEQARAKKK